MSTGSLTIFREAENLKFAVMFRQCDGYPSGHGRELTDFLRGKIIVNGIRSGDKNNFNGMGCLAAQVVAHFKTGIGGFYLVASDYNFEDFIYTVYPGVAESAKESWPVLFKVQRKGVILYNGPADDFDAEKIQETAEREIHAR